MGGAESLRSGAAGRSRALSPRELRVLRAVCDDLYPERPPLGRDATAEVTDAVAAWVAGQVEALPGYLFLPYRAALFGFGWLPVLRWGRTYPALPGARRLAWLSLWSDGPIPPCRDFVKLLRSCALFAWFDHPRVRAALENGPERP
jgi:hypothetical protein